MAGTRYWAADEQASAFLKWLELMAQVGPTAPRAINGGPPIDHQAAIARASWRRSVTAPLIFSANIRSLAAQGL